MAVERASFRAVRKPWGSADLRPWAQNAYDGDAIGELWLQRADANARESQVLVKLLFTKEPLSIQVHPSDAFSRTMGLCGGKTEAWYILSAEPGAKVAVGLEKPVTPLQLRQAIDDGSIVDLVRWRPVAQGDVVFVPAGTIHAIGPGLMIAEVQQRNDVTYRMYDFGRGRALDVPDAVAAAFLGPTECLSTAVRFSDARTLLIADPHFVLERIDLAAGSSWDFHIDKPTWLFVLNGAARLGTLDLSVADAVFAEADHVHVNVGQCGIRCLAAYPGPGPSRDLLQATPTGASAQRCPQPAAKGALPGVRAERRL